MQAPAIAPENGQASPEVMRRVQQTVQDNISAELSPSDRLIVQEATERLMSRARTGFWVGSLVGGLIAFRGRWAAGQAARRTGIQPRLFFPSAKEGAGSVKAQQETAKKAAQEGAGSDAAGDEMRRGRAVFFGKAMGYGILGSIAGCATIHLRCTRSQAEGSADCCAFAERGSACSSARALPANTSKPRAAARRSTKPPSEAWHARPRSWGA